MRIFVGIDLDPEVRSRIERFVEGVQGFAPEARWTRAASLHITLKFIGEQPAERIDVITAGLQQIKAPSFELKIAGYGFFPTAKAPRVFWLGIEGDQRLTELAMKCDATLAEFGIPREERPYSPHLTLARGSGRSSGSPNRRTGDRANSVFTSLQKRLDGLKSPEFGTVDVREFVLYKSQLSPSGSIYTKLRTFPLESS